MTNAALESIIEFQKAVQTESLRTWRRWMNLPKVPHIAREVKIATTPHDVVYEEDSLKLLRYRNEHTIDFNEPVLICFALVNRPYILDLQPPRSVVRQLLKRGFDVYLVDWGVPTAADRTLRLEDYVCGFIKNVARFSGDEGLLNLWTREEYFDVDGLVDAFGNCPGAFLQSGFQIMKPLQNYVEKYTGFLDKLDDDAYLENFFAMERWVNDNIPIAGETFRQFVKHLYQQNELVRGEFRLGDKPIKLQNITCPLLTLTADQDHLVPANSTLAIKHYVSSKFVEHMSINAGHIGLAVSSKAHSTLWPDAAMWIADHSTNRTK